MSEFDLEEITDRAGTGAPNFTHGFNINGSDSGLSGATHTVGTTEPSSPSNGDTWWNTDNDSYNVYIDGDWKGWLGDTYSSNNAWSGNRAIVGGTKNSGYSAILYFDISGSGGGSANFGDLTVARRSAGGAGSTSRSCFFGGYTTSFTRANTIDYVTPSTTGNAQDFGDMTVGRSSVASCSNGTRALTAGGYSTGYINTVDYITVANTGNATDFGDLSSSSNVQAANQAGGDLTRAVFTGGIGSNPSTTIDYFTYSSLGNATDFGDLAFGVGRSMACSDATRVVQMGGSNAHSPSNKNMQYITTQTTGNATDFGDLLEEYSEGSACANATKGIAISSHNVQTQMEVITIQTPANSTDFGDLITGMYRSAAASGSPS